MPAYSPSLTSLIAALRAEFTTDGLTSLRVALDVSDHRDAATAVLHRAISNAVDPSYDPGDDAHPATREHFARTGAGLDQATA